MIKDLGGRLRSERTDDEYLQMLLKEFEKLSGPEREALMLAIREMGDPAMASLAESQENGAPVRIYDAMSESEYLRPMVDIETFIKDPYYLGTTCDNLWPKLLDDLKELFEGGYREAILTGSIGWGKTFFASIALIRVLYEISCLRDPHRSFGIAKDTNIALIAISVSEQLAMKVVFENIVTKIKQSPYFLENFPFDVTKREIRFPHNVWVAPRASTDTAALGLNVFGGIMDEGNFFEALKRGAAANEKWGNRDKAQALYDQLVRRMKSRFMRGGRMPGMMIVVSSKRTKDDFTAKRVRDSKDDPEVFVRDYAMWDVKPDAYGQKTFKVMVGNETVPSRILKPEEVEPVKQKLNEAGQADSVILIDVPEDYRKDFESDLEGSIRDVAGVETVSISPFIQQRDRLEACIGTAESPHQHPFSVEDWDQTGSGSFLWDRLCSRSMIRDGAEMFEGWQPKFHPGVSRHVHIDPSLVSDATGICCGCVIGFKTVQRRNLETGETYTEPAPVIWIDMMLRIVPPVGGEIDHAQVRGLVHQMRQHGFAIGYVSMDQYNSAASLQIFTTQGIEAERVSVDKPMDAYDTLKAAIYEGRVMMYRYEPVLRELRSLQHDKMRNKVDHPRAGCFVGSTRIPLLDGTLPMIEDLVGKNFWVYSSLANGVVVPGKARGKFTKETSELVDVVLDSGAVERCTPDHLWRLWNGSYKPARDLRPGVDRLMPINRQWPVNGGYERITDKNGSRILTHHMAWCAANGPLPEGSVVHHKNHQKTDNRPENLEASLLAVHSREHTALRHVTDHEWRERLYRGARAFNHSDEGRRKHAEAILRTLALMTPEQVRARARARDAFRNDIDLARLDELRSDPGATNANSAARILGCGRNVVVRVLKDHGIASWDEFMDKLEPGTNHKVRAVIPVRLAKPIPVFDLEVDGHSNFALASGVFVHNSKDVADALAGVVYSLTTKYRGAPMGIMRGISQYGDPLVDQQREIVLPDNFLMPFLTG